MGEHAFIRLYRAAGSALAPVIRRVYQRKHEQRLGQLLGTGRAQPDPHLPERWGHAPAGAELPPTAWGVGRAP